MNHKRPYPSLVVADSFIVDSTSRKGQWRIVPDPGKKTTTTIIAESSRNNYHFYADILSIVFAHNFYLCDCKEGEVFLISSGWLHSSLKSIAQALQTLSNSDGDNEGKTADAANLVLDRTPSPSQCIPIYAPKSKSNAGLNGIFIVQDPFIGHVAFIRLDSKQLIAINITMHTKLCQLQMSIRVSSFLSK